MTRYVGHLGRLEGTLLALVMTLLLIPVYSGEALADTFTADAQVADAPDTNPGNGKCDAVPETPGQQCTLRAAVQEANALDGRDTIVLTEGTYALTIPNEDSTGDLRPDPEQKAETGDLDILDRTIIKGAGLSETTVQDEAGDRIFHVQRRAVRASISGLTVTGGNGTPVSDDPTSTTDPDGLSPRGGGVFNAATLALRNVAVRDNEADFGGGINNRGTLTLQGTTVSENTAFFGGGVYSEGPLRVNDSTISNNMARRGISDFGGFGGGLYNNTASASLTNSTVSSNTAEERGGGIDNVFGDIQLTNVTVFQNVSPNGTSIANDGSRTYLRNTIVAKGTSTGVVITPAENCVGDRTVSLGNNLSDDDSCNLNESSDQSNEDPLLAPIPDDDDPTALIFEPRPGSPAIDKAANRACPPVDQRGVKRPKDGDNDGTAVCDVGSVEARPPSSGV